MRTIGLTFEKKTEKNKEAVKKTEKNKETAEEKAEK